MLKRKWHGREWGVMLAVMATLAVAQPASAEIIYATSISLNQIYSVDTNTHAVTPVFNPGVNLDSLLFDPNGRIIYSELNSGIVNAFNHNTNTNVNLASGLAQPIDLALEPGLTSVITSEASANRLRRISLAGGVMGALPLGLRPDGVIYDASGRLFVNVSTGFTANDSQVRQIDPTTGAVLHSTGNTNVFLDGLTYDSFTGKLFASDYNNGKILEIDPNTLAFTTLTPLGSALSQPDGITSDGMGNLFIASRANAHVIQYNIATNTDTLIATINGLDDLAPASGLGAPNSVPEPSSLLLAGMGAVILVHQLCGKRARLAV